MHYLSLTQDQFVYTCPDRDLRLVTSDPYAVLLVGLLLEVDYWECDETFGDKPPGMTWRQRSIPFTTDLYRAAQQVRKRIQVMKVDEFLDPENEDATLAEVVSRLNQTERDKRALILQFKDACDAGDEAWADRLQEQLQEQHYLNNDETRYLQTAHVKVEDPLSVAIDDFADIFDDY